MAEKIFKEQFCEIQKIKVCTTSAELDFNNYTEAGTYEIFEDMGNGQSRVYLLLVDKSASGACTMQVRIYCGKTDKRYITTGGAWTAWEAVTGGGSGGGSDGGYYKPVINQTDDTTAEFDFIPSEATMPAVEAVTLTLPRGAKGAAGYTPIRGTDYWTEVDKAEIKGYVDDAILGGAW